MPLNNTNKGKKAKSRVSFAVHDEQYSSESDQSASNIEYEVDNS